MAKPLKDKKKIEDIFKIGHSVKSKGLTLKYFDFCDDKPVSFGVSVPKKLFSSAVKRNLIKRRVREQLKALGFIKLTSPGICFFIIYSSKEILSSDQIKRSLKDLRLNI